MVRTSGQYLVYPVNMYLDALFPGVKVHCNSEVAENQQSRFDMRWPVCRPGKPDVTAAILEYKARTLFTGTSLRGGGSKQERLRRK